MSDSDVYLSPPRVVIHRNQVVNKKWKLRVRSNPTQENRVRQTKISTKSDNDGFSPSGGVQVKIRTKIPVVECLVCCVCVLFSMTKSMLRMSSCLRSCPHNILFLRTKCGEGFPCSVL